MEEKDNGQLGFLLEMSNCQITAYEFFSNVLLDSLKRNFGYQNVVISCFDTHNNFLSWIDHSGIQMCGEDHPYRAFSSNNPVRNRAYQDAVRDHLTYFNVEPRLYRATDIIAPIDYGTSAYVRFIEENFHAHYSVTFALGMNAYIQITFFKSSEEGDFSDDEMERLRKIYVFVANSYKNFKKHEQTKIISNIRDEIISSGEKAYLVTDDFMHVMSYNDTALQYLRDIFGPTVAEDEIVSDRPCTWLPFLLGSDGAPQTTDRVRTTVIKDYIFKVYTYEQSYSHGIVDRYHWITISRNETVQLPSQAESRLPLTQTERKVAELLKAGLTYQAIADQMIISYHTVKNHVQNIYTKCGVTNRFQLYKLLEK